MASTTLPAMVSGNASASGAFQAQHEVWQENLEAEFALIRDIVQTYNYISMDTEFPGTVARPIGSFNGAGDFQFQTIRVNCDLLKIIQLGLTFSNEKGELAPGVCTFQFNFAFSLGEDIYAQDSIDLLTRSGIDFARHQAEGIDPLDFAELLISSGIVLCDDIKWVSFHSGYDFGYLLKLLTCKELPTTAEEFADELQLYFNGIYDIKWLMRYCDNLKGGLNKVAEDLEVDRTGAEHQAGSDSLLTQATFFKMRQLFFENELDDDKHLNIIFGIGRGGHHKGGVPGGGDRAAYEPSQGHQGHAEPAM